MLMTEDEFAAYQSLSEETEDHRWAFGTGFTDPLEGVDATVPDGVDAQALAAYCLMLGDDALIYSHRLQQWMTRMPELEEETALANIALDLLGQARMLLARAGQAEGALLGGGNGRGEDELAFFRDEHEFRNVRLAEHVDADFAELAGRLLVVSAWRLALFGRLAGAKDPVLAAIAAKGVNELAYHRDYAAGWVIRLGDGTALSHGKMQAALAAIWPLVEELFDADPVSGGLPGVAADPGDVSAEVDRLVVTITPTYSGCPALREIAHDLRYRLGRAGFAEVTVRTALAPAWSSDWITAEGRRKLQEAGIAPPHAVSAGQGPASRGPVPLTLTGTRREPVACPRCGSADTTQTAAFSATACKALFRCDSCREPFEYVKDI